MIEVQRYSQLTKTLYEISKEDHMIHIGSVDGNDTLSIPIDILDWIIFELRDYRDDKQFNHSIKE